MSALGQKQTYAMQKAMSALPPIATVKADISKKACLLYPRKRTCAVHQPMSAMGQKQTLRHLWLTQPTWAPPTFVRAYPLRATCRIVSLTFPVTGRDLAAAPGCSFVLVHQILGLEESDRLA
jgi:hypothetical protein